MLMIRERGLKTLIDCNSVPLGCHKESSGHRRPKPPHPRRQI